jgi:hypothetical protein
MTMIIVTMKFWTVTVTSPHHIYKDNFYNSVRLAQALLDRNVRVCSIVRANRCIPHDLERDGMRLKKGNHRSGGKVM